jgi:hypothetical protein
MFLSLLIFLRDTSLWSTGRESGQL